MIQQERREAESKKEKQQVLFNSSDSEDNLTEEEFHDKNIGMYQKLGHCYSDVKSFNSQVVCMALAALWFSDKKQKQDIQTTSQKKAIMELRKQIIQDIGYLSLRLKHTLQPSNLDLYKKVGAFLKGQENIFILSKGTGCFVGEFIA
jgi:hypothetical protein